MSEKPKTQDLTANRHDGVQHQFNTGAPRSRAHPQVLGRLDNIDRELGLLNTIFSDPAAQISQTDAEHLVKTLAEFEALRVRLVGRTVE